MQSQRTDEHPRLGKGRGRLEGKVAVVTGADSGIGRATARLFGREGAKLVCVDIQESGSLRIDRLIREDGGEAVFLPGDVTVREDCDRMVAAALDHYRNLDILFNNVGGSVPGRIGELTEEQWDWSLNLNLKGIFHGVRAALPHFLQRGRGAIVNTASTHGLLSVAESPAYCSAKAAIVNLTRQLALDYGPGIRVNCVCPGPTETPQYLRNLAQSADPEGQRAMRTKRVAALQRLARPEEIAYAVLFLASDEASYITGHALVVDGGQTIDV
jgi:3-oxoacyl-[acyl-carrier protein] reductase